MYTMGSTRSEIPHAIGVIRRIKHTPGKSHGIATKHMLRYHVGTKDHNLIFLLTKPVGVDTYTDSYFFSCLENRYGSDQQLKLASQITIQPCIDSFNFGLLGRLMDIKYGSVYTIYIISSILWNIMNTIPMQGCYEFGVVAGDSSPGLHEHNVEF